jgi:cell division protease FtsH
MSMFFSKQRGRLRLPQLSDKLSSVGPEGSGPPWQRYLIAGLAVLLLAIALSFMTQQEPTELSYTGFKDAVRNGYVAEVTFQGEHIRGRFVEQAPDRDDAAGDGEKTNGAAPSEQAGADTGAAADAFTPGGVFTSTMPQVQDLELLDLLETHDVEITAQPTGDGVLGRMLVTMLPWVIVLGAFLYLSYRMQKRMMGGAGGSGDGGGGIFGFGKSKAKRFREQDTQTGFDDVAGVENAKADLREIIDHLADPQRFRAVGATMPKGVLLVGPPGTGKTLLARAVAGEAGVPFYSISGSEFVEMFVGVGASRVRDMFAAAKKESPCVIFIDEIDAVGRTRGAGMGGGHDEREQTLNQILSEMDGFAPNEDIVVLAATNRPDVLDKALLRPGRFDRKVHLELPDREARVAMLKVHVKGVALAEDVDLERVAARTAGFSGADLKNLVNEAALLAGRQRKDKVDMALFADARDKLVLGAERERGISDEERELIAYHECGHALMAWLLPEADELDKVTIIPRGRALGATEQVPDEERRTYRERRLRDRIAVMLGGRVAEQVVFNEVTTGAEADLSQATDLARRMVSRWGMSEAIGPVSFKRGDDHVFLGREMAQAPEYSDQTAKLIDDEIKRLISDVERRARKLLEDNRDRLKRLAERLLEAETLAREEIDALLGADYSEQEDRDAADRPRRAAAG